VFLLAGVCGVVLVVPPLFLEERFGSENPPPVNHPEFYYGFFGLALAWQLMFLVIARDPIRYRLAMLPAMLEKASFAIAAAVLYRSGRFGGATVGFAAMDAVWFLLFLIAYLRIVRQPQQALPG
jgi:hypothetical protein